MISYYDLLGMVKDKTNPKKIKYYDKVYEWNNRNYAYIDDNFYYLNADIDGISMFDKNIEIIEEDKGIEELIIYKNADKKDILSDGNGNNYGLGGQTKIVVDKLNELIKEVNKLRKEDK